MEDIDALKPTTFTSVPRIFNRFYDKMTGRLKELTGVKKWLANKGFSSKKKRFSKTGHSKHWLWDTLVYNKLAKVLIANIELKLESIPDMEYLVTDKDDSGLP